MWRMLSSMETSKKKCTCNHPLAIHTQVVKFVAFAMLFMTSSKLLELGLKSLAQLLLSRVSLRVLMTLLSLSEDPLLVSLLFFFMLMIWLLLEMILQLSALFSTSFVSILRWKIRALSAIFLVLRLSHPLIDTIFPMLIMLLIFSLKLVSLTTRLFPLPWNIMQSSHPWMVNLYPMLLAIVSWLVVWSISLLLVRIFHMPWVWLVSSWMLLVLSTSDSSICQGHTLSWSPLLVSVFSRASCLFRCGLGRWSDWSVLYHRFLFLVEYFSGLVA